MKEKRALELERNSKRKNNRNRTFKDRLDAAGAEYEPGQQVSSVGLPEAVTNVEAQPADVISRDSGVISPSENGQEDTESEVEAGALQVHDTPTLRVTNNNYLTPVKAEIVTNELDEDGSDSEDKMVSKQKVATSHHQPPPYHIAATRSKHAGNFLNIQQNLPGSKHQNNNEEEHFYENQVRS